MKILISILSLFSTSSLYWLTIGRIDIDFMNKSILKNMNVNFLWCLFDWDWDDTIMIILA